MCLPLPLPQGAEPIKLAIPFVGQLVLQLALLVEQALAAAHKGDKGLPADFKLKAQDKWLDNERSMHTHLCKYVASAVEGSRGQQFFFLASDKGNPGGYALQNTLITFPSNLALVAPPAVARAHDSGIDYSQKEEQLVNRKGINGKMVQVSTSVDTRHRAWLQRGRFGAVQMAWRPQKQHRVSAKHWLGNTDNQLRIVTSSSGWRFFLPSKADTWTHWSSWPHATIGIDLGSDGLSAVMSLMYYYRVNVLLYPDISDFFHRAQTQALKDAGLYRLWILLMVSWNLVHGKDLDEARFRELRD